jgi:hypothetical protein
MHHLLAYAETTTADIWVHYLSARRVLELLGRQKHWE